MFCEQCEQTASGNGCHQWGACGKSPEVNAIQDLLVYCLRSIAPIALKAYELGIPNRELDRFTCESMFSTMTNVNFSTKRFSDSAQQALQLRKTLKQAVEDQSPTPISWPEICNYQPDFAGNLSEQGQQFALDLIQKASGNIDIYSLQLTTIYGVKGLASYAFHAYELGQEDEKIYQFIYEALIALDRQDLDLNAWVGLALKVGEMNLRAMELLDAGHTGHYGHPTPTTVSFKSSSR